MWILQARNAKRGWWRFSLKALCLPPVDVGMDHTLSDVAEKWNIWSVLDYTALMLFLSLCVSQSPGFCSEELWVLSRAGCRLPGNQHDWALPADTAIIEQMTANRSPRWLNVNWKDPWQDSDCRKRCTQEELTALLPIPESTITL